jgi:hypothetical protein
VTHEVRCGIQRLLTLVIDDDQGPGVSPFRQDFAHNRLGEEQRTFQVDGFEFFARAYIDQPYSGVLFTPLGKLLRFNENPGIQLMARLDMSEDLFNRKIAVPLADLSKRFLGLKGATAAPTDMVSAKESPLSARICLQYLPHG